MSHRYLLHISYIGTHFRGLQRTQINEIIPTVQSSIELALKPFSSVNEPILVLSSRTDKGVHALNSAVHFDLETKSGYPFPESAITRALNKFFDRQNLHLRINKTEIVPDTFHARFSAKRRTYLYRLAIAKQEQKSSFPIDEIDRCFFVTNPKFDINLANKAAELIKGRHDFRTFMGVTRDKIGHTNHPFFALRKIESIEIEPGESTSNIFTKPLADDAYNYFNVHVTAPSFLNRQVRRVVAVILGAAQEKVSLREVYEMLTIPSRHSWLSRLAPVPACGLYLCQVEYDDNDKRFPASDLSSATDHISSDNELPH